MRLEKTYQISRIQWMIFIPFENPRPRQDREPRMPHLHPYTLYYHLVCLRSQQEICLLRLNLTSSVNVDMGIISYHVQGLELMQSITLQRNLHQHILGILEYGWIWFSIGCISQRIWVYSEQSNMISQQIYDYIYLSKIK